jgi:hypothetical protein
LTAEAVHVDSRGTTVLLAVSARSGNKTWLSKARGSYLIDGAGVRHELIREHHTTSDPRTGRWSATYARFLMPHETYKFSLTFSPAAVLQPKLLLHHPDFKPLAVCLAGATEADSDDDSA